MANFPTYPINMIEQDGVYLKFGKALKGPTITEILDEPKEESKKEPPFPDLFIHKPKLKESTHFEFDILNELSNVNIKIPLLQALQDIPVYTKMYLSYTPDDRKRMIQKLFKLLDNQKN